MKTFAFQTKGTKYRTFYVYANTALDALKKLHSKYPKLNVTSMWVGEKAPEILK